jgi:hypothetical protein
VADLDGGQWTLDAEADGGAEAVAGVGGHGGLGVVWGHLCGARPAEGLCSVADHFADPQRQKNIF